MPPEPDTPSVGEQLADALEAAGVSQNELARRLAANDHSKPESKRRWIIKVLADQVRKPDMSAIEPALSLPAGHFVLPTPAQRERRRARLAELQAEVERIAALLEVYGDRIESLERRAGPEELQARTR